MKHVSTLAAVGALVLACAPMPDAASGQRLYLKHCQTCHGTSGAGDGPLAADFSVPPANLRLLSAQNDGVFPEADVISKIHGYPVRNHQALMPEFDTLTAGPRTVWTGPDGTQLSVPADLLAVVDYLKTLQDGAK